MSTETATLGSPFSFPVLVIGGHGFFGRRLVARLARQPGLQVTVAGRTARGGGIALDAEAPDFAARLAALAPAVVVNASGPFQGMDYRVAEACIAARAHYVDLADGRAFVAGIGALDPAARAAGVAVLSGASSVPALSSAAVDHLAHGATTVERIDIGISPGNRTERGLSTMQAVLGYCGRPLPGGAVGWAGTWHHDYPAPVGRRRLSPCDVPDLVLLPERYPGRPEVVFGAGLELGVLHRGMNLMAWAARRGCVRDWAVHARALKAIADPLRHLGSDAGAMHVAVTADGRRRTWHLLATHGDGPYVPTLAAAALVRRLRAGEVAPGARPCVGELPLAAFDLEAQGLHIRMGEG